MWEKAVTECFYPPGILPGLLRADTAYNCTLLVSQCLPLSSPREHRTLKEHAKFAHKWLLQPDLVLPWKSWPSELSLRGQASEGIKYPHSRAEEC